jgi:CPA1 family monovalent cation:H+ antiporter
VHTFHIVGILTSLAAAFGYINYRFLRLQLTIGLMLQSLLLSVLLMVLLGLGVDTVTPVRQILAQIDFNRLLLEGMLSFLLFAGSLFVKNEELLNVKVDIALFATAGVVISTALIGSGLLLASQLLGLGIGPIHCFLFGALISPTDPVAVLPVLRSHGIGDNLNAQIGGESLFNDGIGVVLFLSLLPVNGALRGAEEALFLFVREAAGGILFGVVLGWLGYLLIKSVDNYQLEILLTLAVVTGGYSLATALQVSGPLAMVMAGLLIGGPGRRLAMSERTRKNLDRFWELVEEILNAILFTLIGLEILAIIPRLTRPLIVAGLVGIPLVLLARYLSVGAIAFFLRCRGTYEAGSVSIMTWSGLRGGIPIALALSVPEAPERDTLLVATYAVVAFSILVQGSTLRYLLAFHSRR